MNVITKFQWGPLIYLNLYFFNIFLKVNTSLHKKHNFMEDGLHLKITSKICGQYYNIL